MVSYFISAKQVEQIQGINVSLSAEFEQGKTPRVVSFNGNGQIQKADGKTVYVNVSGSYNVEENRFENLNGSSIPDGFVAGLETKIVAFFNTIETDQTA